MNEEHTNNIPHQILLVEDSLADIALMKRALQQVPVRHQLHFARDGVAALAFLRREGKFAGAPRPDLILLDLNLPKKDGRAVLSELKRDGSLLRIPVVVLTASEADDDLRSCYDLHANAYMAKAYDFDGLVQRVQAICEYWLSYVSLPSG